MSYESDEGAWSIGVVLLVMFAVFIVWLSAPAHSQEPSGAQCPPAGALNEQLEKQFGETVTAGGVMDGQQFMYMTTNPTTQSWTVLVRRPDGTACVVLGGKGFALADPAPMKGPGL
jgi:hypothetical protein